MGVKSHLFLVMRKTIFLLLLICSCNVFSNKIPEQEPVISVLQVHGMFSEYNISTTGIFDIVDKEEKVSACTLDYIKKQSKSYLKAAQGNLFDLLHNFDNIVSKIYGKKGLPDNIPYEEKVELLAKVQCETYYKIGVLK